MRALAFLILILIPALALANPVEEGCVSGALRAIVGGAEREPLPISIRPLHLSRLDSSHIKMMERKGQTLHYVLNYNGDLLVTSDPLDLAGHDLWAAHDLKDPSRPDFLIKEAGELRSTGKEKGFAFKSTYSVGLSPEETRDLLSKVEKDHPELKVTHEPSPDLENTREFTCLDFLKKSRKGSGFVVDTMLAGNVINRGVFVLEDLMNEKQLGTPAGRKLFAADVTADNATTVISSIVAVMVRNQPMPVQYLFRTGTGYLNVSVVSNGIYHSMMGEENQQQSDAITSFNQVHWAYRMAVGPQIDNQIFHNVPLLAFTQCMKGSPFKVFVSPRAVRFMERTLSATIYYTGRHFWLKSAREADAKNAAAKAAAAPAADASVK